MGSDDDGVPGVWRPRQDTLLRILRRVAGLIVALPLAAVAIWVAEALQRHPERQFAVGLALGSVWITAALLAVVGLALGYWGWARHRRKAVYGTAKPRGSARVWSRRLAVAGGYAAMAGILLDGLMYGRRGHGGFARHLPILAEGWWLALAIAATLMVIVAIVLPGIQGWGNFLYLTWRPSVVTARATPSEGPESIRVLYRPSLGFNGVATVHVDGTKRGALSAGGGLGLNLGPGEHTIAVSFAGLVGGVDRSARVVTAPGASCDVVVSSGLIWAVGAIRHRTEREFRIQRPDLSSVVAIPDVFAKRRTSDPRIIDE